MLSNPLKVLKAAASARLSGVHADVVTYITELEHTVAANRALATACTCVGFIFGVAAGHWL